MSVPYELAPCPACGARESRAVADAEDVRAEVEALWAFHGRRLRPETPPERLVDRVAFSQRPPWRVAACARCGTLYRNPRERERALREAYEGEAPTVEAMRALLETQREAYAAQAGRLTQVAAARGIHPGRGLEVGSYVGGFLEAASALGWRFQGVDVNPDANAFTRSLGYTVHDGSLECVQERDAFGAVAIWNCLDQIHDPRETLAAARRVAREGAIVAVRVPNGAFYERLRRRLDGRLAPVARTVLAHNNLLGFPYRQAFSVDGARRLLSECAFEPVEVVGDALVPIADEWTRGWAALEERALKRVLRGMASLGAERAPWFEVYAVATRTG